jgi:hypothetical protein
MSANSFSPDTVARLRQERAPHTSFDFADHSLDYGANRSPAILFIARQGDLRGKVLEVLSHGGNHHAEEHPPCLYSGRISP